MLLIVNPHTYMNAKVAIIEVGIERLAMSVVRQSRMKRRIVRLTSTAASMRWTFTSWIEFSMNRDWSRITCTWTSSGSTARISSRRCLTASTTATVFVPDCFWTMRLTARSPAESPPLPEEMAVHRRLRPRGSSIESVTVPMS